MRLYDLVSSSDSDKILKIVCRPEAS